MDAPIHTRFRKIFQKAFLPQVVAQWGESVVDPVVNRLMSTFIDRGEADLIEEFTHHYPFQVIYAQVELEPSQAPIFHKLAIAQILSSIGAPQGPEASAKLGTFFGRSEEHTSELQSLMRISYAVFCLKKKKTSTV